MWSPHDEDLSAYRQGHNRTQHLRNEDAESRIPYPLTQSHCVVVLWSLHALSNGGLTSQRTVSAHTAAEATPETTATAATAGVGLDQWRRVSGPDGGGLRGGLPTYTNRKVFRQGTANTNPFKSRSTVSSFKSFGSYNRYRENGYSSNGSYRDRDTYDPYDKENDANSSSRYFDDIHSPAGRNGFGFGSREEEDDEDVALNLDDCLDSFTSEETLGGQDEWFCSRCKKHQRARKKMDIWKVPHILVVHLKRFKHSALTRRKIDTRVEFPLEGLDISERVLGQTGAFKYDLFAVSNHIGSSGFGHYTAYAKSPVDKTWHHFDDSTVSTVGPDEIVSSKAYVLFYRLRRGPNAQRVPRPPASSSGAVSSVREAAASSSSSAKPQIGPSLPSGEFFTNPADRIQKQTDRSTLTTITASVPQVPPADSSLAGLTHHSAAFQGTLSHFAALENGKGALHTHTKSTELGGSASGKGERSSDSSFLNAAGEVADELISQLRQDGTRQEMESELDDDSDMRMAGFIPKPSVPL